MASSARSWSLKIGGSGSGTPLTLADLGSTPRVGRRPSHFNVWAAEGTCVDDAWFVIITTPAASSQPQIVSLGLRGGVHG